MSFADTKREVPPGYTGHIPYKSGIIGISTGKANKISLAAYEMNSNQSLIGLSHMQTLNRTPANVSPSRLMGNDQEHDDVQLDPLEFYKQQKMKSISNVSKDASSWLCGPRHDIRIQHIPGYKGFVPGVHAENVFGKGSSRCAAASLGNRIPRGHDLTPERRYVSHNQKAHNHKNFRRLVECPGM